MEKLKLKHIKSKIHFVSLFKEYCKSTLGWVYLGDNPFEILGVHKRTNPRTDRALINFAQIIKNFEGDIIDLEDFYDSLPDGE